MGDREWIGFDNEHTSGSGDRCYAFGPWDTTQRHKDVAGDHRYTTVGSCSSTGAVWVKLSL